MRIRTWSEELIFFEQRSVICLKNCITVMCSSSQVLVNSLVKLRLVSRFWSGGIEKDREALVAVIFANAFTKDVI